MLHGCAVLATKFAFPSLSLVRNSFRQYRAFARQMIAVLMAVHKRSMSKVFRPYRASIRHKYYILAEARKYLKKVCDPVKCSSARQ